MCGNIPLAKNLYSVAQDSHLESLKETLNKLAADMEKAAKNKQLEITIRPILYGITYKDRDFVKEYLEKLNYEVHSGMWSWTISWKPIEYTVCPY